MLYFFNSKLRHVIFLHVLQNFQNTAVSKAIFYILTMIKSEHMLS